MELPIEKRETENVNNEDNPQTALDSVDGSGREAEEQRERQGRELKAGLHPLKVPFFPVNLLNLALPRFRCINAHERVCFLDIFSVCSGQFLDARVNSLAFEMA